jgi:hypothetical protein
MPHDNDDEPVWVANWEAAKKGGGGLTRNDKIIIGCVVGGVGAIAIILGAVLGKRAADKRKAMGGATKGQKRQNAKGAK